MEIKKEKTDELVKIFLSLKDQEWEKYQNVAKDELFKNLEVKGFRKGKVPEDIAIKTIGNSKILEKAISLLIDKKQDELLEKIHQEEIITRPELSIDKISDMEVSICLSSFLFPKIKFGDFANLDIKKEEVNISDANVEEEFKKLNNLFEKEEIYSDEKHKVKNGDFVKIDFHGTIDGKDFEGGHADNYRLEIGSHQFVGNFEEQLIGWKVNDKKDIKVVFPETYPEEKLAGREVTFAVKINQISRTVPLDEKEIKEKLEKMNFKSIENLKEHLRKILIDDASWKEMNNYFDKFVEQILNLKETNFKIPEMLINSEVNKEFEKTIEDLKKQGIDKDYYLDKILNTNESNFKEKNVKPQAIKKIKRGLIYSKLLKDLNIANPTEKEIEEEYQGIAKEQKVSVEEIKKHFSVEKITGSIIFIKLIDNLEKKINSAKSQGKNENSTQKTTSKKPTTKKTTKQSKDHSIKIEKTKSNDSKKTTK